MEHVPGYPDWPRTRGELDVIAVRYLQLHRPDGVTKCAVCESFSDCEPRTWAERWTKQRRREAERAARQRRNPAVRSALAGHFSFDTQPVAVARDRSDATSSAVMWALALRSFL
ncbi:hypothetical protein [Flindersiella endophytica]